MLWLQVMVETQGGPAVPGVLALAFVPGVAESFGEGHEKYEESYGSTTRVPRVLLHSHVY